MKFWACSKFVQANFKVYKALLSQILAYTVYICDKDPIKGKKVDRVTQIEKIKTDQTT